MRKTVIIAILLFISSYNLNAQGTRSKTTSLTIGHSRNDFRYVATTSSRFFYDFKSSFPVLVISSERNFLSVGYGTQESNLVIGVPSMTMLEISVGSGLNIFLFKSLSNLPFGVFIPLRSNLDYRHLTIDNDEAFVDIPDLNMLGATGGLGVGVRFQPLTGRSNIMFFGTIVSSVGFLSDLSDSEDAVLRLVRATDFNFEAKLGRLLGSRLGLTLGYTFRSLRWTNQNVGSFDEVIEAIGKPSRIPKRRGQSLLRLGINW